MPSPSWLLLAWSGAAATLAAALFGTAIGRGRANAWSLVPRPRASTAVGWHALVGLLIYPLAYGILFEVSGRADIRFGVLVGAVHALGALLLARPRRDPGHAARIAMAHLVYAVTIAWLYITP